MRDWHGYGVYLVTGLAWLIIMSQLYKHQLLAGIFYLDTLEWVLAIQ